MKIAKQHYLLLSLGLGLATVAVLGLAAPTSITLKVPAASMKNRADLERTDFVTNHLMVQHDYPLAKIFQAALAFPTNSSAGAQVLGRGGGSLTCAIVGPKHATFTNTGPSTVRLPLKALLENQDIRILVEIPKKVVLDVTWDDTNSINIKPTTALQVTFVDQPAPGGVSIGIASVQQLDSLSASASDLVLQSHAVGGGTGLQLDMQLNVAPHAFNMLLPRALLAFLYVKERAWVVIGGAWRW